MLFSVQLNQLTSLIISISLKVRRSSQSTFTMWPCRWAFVSWTGREREKGGRKRGRETRKGKRFTKIQKNTEVEVLLQQNWSQHGGSCANSSTNHAQIQCQQPVQHLRSHTLSSQSTPSVSVGVGNVSTHLAMNRKPTTQLVRISTHS